MVDVRQLSTPVIAAPMAGGPSTPELAVAVASAGGLGFLAGGYRAVDDLMAQVATVRAGVEVFGVNLFVPEPEPADVVAAARYRDLLAPLAARFGIDDLPHPRLDDDGYPAKIAALLDDPVPVVSFTFGCPTPGIVQQLHRVSTAVFVAVTDPVEARQAVAVGADALVVQGPEAGGHRATFNRHADPDARPLPALLAAVRAETDLPLIAAGGLATADQVGRALGAAAAVQLGTVFLGCDEAGTAPAHRSALTDPSFTETVVTRAFSGRWARTLRNAFVDRFGAQAPAEYPALHQVSAPLRRAAAAAADLQHTHLWAGTGWREVRSGPARDIIAHLTGGT